MDWTYPFKSRTHLKSRTAWFLRHRFDSLKSRTSPPEAKLFGLLVFTSKSAFTKGKSQEKTCEIAKTPVERPMQVFVCRFCSSTILRFDIIKLICCDSGKILSEKKNHLTHALT